MAGRRLWAVGLAAAFALAVLAVIAIVALRHPQGEARPADVSRPRLMLLTSVPLVFGEQFSLEHGGSKALKAIETRYTVVPIAATDAAELSRAKLLLMAHPLAQTSSNLVALDRWVRQGGRLLLLADPKLDWPSERPLGDTLRPPPAFADTGLLTHWGLALHAPDEIGPVQRPLGGLIIVAGSPGTITGGQCNIGAAGFVARCSVGKGRVTVVADADFMNVDNFDGPIHDNLNALLSELRELES